MNQTALASLKTQSTNLAQSLFMDGIVDSQFAQILALQDEGNPNFVTELITLFCTDTEKTINEMSRYVGNPNIDFSKLNSCIHQLKGSSSSIGTIRLKRACTKLREASDARNKERCIQELNVLSREYRILRSKFQSLLQLEQSISALKLSQEEQDIDPTLWSS